MKRGSRVSYLEELKKILSPERVSTNEVILDQHSKDESYHRPSLPDAVVFPISAEEVSKVMNIAEKFKIPIVPFGLGTSLEGHVIPYNGGITVDFSLMDTIIEVFPTDFLVKVQPGVTRSKLNQELKKHGLFFSVDPGADATLGGMAATNASGTTSVRYGIMRDQVRDMEVVLADGTIMHTGNLAAKSSSGYNLNGLFVGSEGTLGCFTELTLRVYGIPELIVAGRASFETVGQAVDAVVSILSAGIQVARIELVDQQSIAQVNVYSGTDYLEVPTLFLEFHGNEAGLMQDMEFAKEILADNKCSEFKFEKDSQSRNQLWEARHNLAYAVMRAHPGKKMMVTDVCLPISELANGIESAKEAMARYELPGGIVGHVGDGNYHALLMLDVNDEEEMKRAESFNSHIVEFALSKGGTCTGEHGVGIGKMKYQSLEHGNSLHIMKALKKTLDPHNILNPGKIFNMN
ncbi:FAD-binding oxidoreductase [Paenisporosarcina antarctica]|uniref:D-lactate dehydrogenase (cytochrome) n=1 Tax=Paenisporosarcina antarctica TaxID=417367 RepID=A0A4P7A377_9BACL|nr:FAD-linked oxidase C-terminal domain-containing protein [Paenisporosarcina antarctica]QBP42436.1 FAD-binding protein [Paenisporosarcina antarctica]